MAEDPNQPSTPRASQHGWYSAVSPAQEPPPTRVALERGASVEETKQQFDPLFGTSPTAATVQRSNLTGSTLIPGSATASTASTTTTSTAATPALAAIPETRIAIPQNIVRAQQQVARQATQAEERERARREEAQQRILALGLRYQARLAVRRRREEIAATAARMAQRSVALTPGGVVIDLGTREGIAIYKQGAKGLETKFDGQPASIKPFLDETKVHACTHGFREAYRVNVAPDGAADDEKDIWDLTDKAQCTNAIARITGDAGYANMKAKLEGTAAADRGEVTAYIKITMLYAHVRDSLTPDLRKKYAPELSDYLNNGTLLLLHILGDTIGSTYLARQNEKTKLETMKFKECGYDITKLHNKMRQTRATVQQLRGTVSDEDQMANLIRAYRTQDVPEWLQHVNNLESKLATGDITRIAALQEQAATYVALLKSSKKWKAQGSSESSNTRQAHGTERPQASGGRNSGASSDTSRDAKIERLKQKNASWKFQRNKSPTATYEHNGKTFHWCTGPGHMGVPMWVAHDPSSCTTNFTPGGSSNSRSSGGGRNSGRESHTSERRSGTNRPTRAQRKAFKAETAKLIQEASGDDGEDYSELIEKFTKLAEDRFGS